MVRICVFCVLLLCGSVTAAWADEMLRIGIEENYPPFSYEEDGKRIGFDVDVSRALCAELHRSCTFVVMSFETCLSALLEGKVDLVVASLSETEERRAQADFTNAYYRTQSVFIGKAGIFYTDTGAEALSGRKIAVQKHTMQEQFVVRKYGGDASLPFNTVSEALGALRRGEADLALTDVLTGLFFLKSEAGAECDFASGALLDEGVTSSAHIVVRKGNDALRFQIDEALPVLRYSGELDRISRKYFPFSMY